jgi:glycosyltransferase 2 family protein
MSPAVQTLLKIVLSGTLLYYLIQKAHLAVIYQTICAADIRYYLLAIGVYITAQPVRTLRWWLLLKEKKISVARIRLLILCFIGTFFSGFLPTIVGGDVVRGYYVFKESNAHDVAFASILVERLCGLIIVVITGCAAGLYFLITQGPSPLITICLAGCSAGLVLAGGIFYQPFFRVLSRPLFLVRRWNIAGKIAEIYHATLSYKGHTKALAWCAVLSLLYELVIIFIHYLMAHALGWSIPGTLFFLAVPVITVVSMFPLSIGGLGVREGAMVVFFSNYGVSAADAISLSLLSYSVTLIAGAMGGMLYPFYKMKG